MNRVVTIEEAAQRLGLSTKTIRRYLQTGKLSGQKVDGRWSISLPAELEDYDSQQTNGNSSFGVEFEVFRSQFDWLKRHVDELAAANRELIAVNRELTAALQDIRSRVLSEDLRRQRLQFLLQEDAVLNPELLKVDGFNLAQDKSLPTMIQDNTEDSLTHERDIGGRTRKTRAGHEQMDINGPDNRVKIRRRASA